MGEIGQALKAVGQLRAARDAATGGGGGGGSGLLPTDPNVAAPLPPLQLTDMSSQGQSQAMASQSMAPGISLADLYAPEIAQPQEQAPPPQAPAAPLDNPYTPYDNNVQQDVAENVGTPEEDITVTGDSYQPKHKEGWLGKTLDVLLMLRGRHPAFKERKDLENFQDIMGSYLDNPERAIRRVGKYVDPETAIRMQQNLSTVRANEELASGRLQDRRDKGLDRMANMTGILAGNKNAEEIYKQKLPMFRQYMSNYGYTAEEAKKLLPDKYDPDQLAALRSSGISVYDQGRLAQSAESAKNLEQYRQTQISLDKLGKQISIKNSAETERHNRETEARLDQAQVLSARESATKNGITLNSAFAPYVNLRPGQYVVSPDKTQVLMKRPDGYIYKFPLQKRNDGSSFIDLDNPIVRGTTVEGYLSK